MRLIGHVILDLVTLTLNKLFAIKVAGMAQKVQEVAA